MVAGEGTIVLDPPEATSGSTSQASSDCMNAVPCLLPAHGPAIAPARPLIQHYLQHRRKRTEQIGRALASVGSSDPAGLVGGVYPDLPAPFHPIAARRILCHLLWPLLEVKRARRNPVHQRRSGVTTHDPDDTTDTDDASTTATLRRTGRAARPARVELEEGLQHLGNVLGGAGHTTPRPRSPVGHR